MKMEESDEYIVKIQNFKLLVENDDDDIALNYLTKHNWKEEEAASAYIKENRMNDPNSKPSNNHNQQNSNLKEKPKPSPIQIPGLNVKVNEPIFNEINIDNSNVKDKIIDIDIKNIKKHPLIEFPIPIPNKEEGFSFKKIFSVFGYKGPNNEEFYATFSPLIETTKLYQNFLMLMKTRKGMIIIYRKEDVLNLSKLVREIVRDLYTFTRIKMKKVIYPVLDQSEEGKMLVEQMKCKAFPCIAIVTLTNNNRSIGVMDVLDKNITIGTINELLDNNEDISNQPSSNPSGSSIGHKNTDKPVIQKPKPSIQKPPMGKPMPIPYPNPYISNNDPLTSFQKMMQNAFYEDILSYQNVNQSQPQFNTNFNSDYNNNSNSDKIDLSDPKLYGDYSEDQFLDDQYKPQSNGEIIQQQKNDLARLEKQEEEKKKEERRQEELKKQEIQKQEEIKKALKLKQEALPKEPDDSNPDKAKILFRYPDGQTKVERKFLKTDKVQLLYDFVDSLGNEIYTEAEYRKYVLAQTTFPIKLCENKMNTLETEGLFPSAVIQIRELE